MTINELNDNKQKNGTAPACQVTTQHDSNVCYVTLYMVGANKSEMTKTTLRLDGPIAAAQFLEQLASAAQKAKLELERSETPVRQLSEACMPSALMMEAGRDERGYFVSVFVDSDHGEAVERVLTFRTKADMFRFFSEAEEAVPGALQMIENVERKQEANGGVS